MEKKVMVSACILICCELGKYPDVAKKSARAFFTSGRWDVIAEVEVGDIPFFSNT